MSCCDPGPRADGGSPAKTDTKEGTFETLMTLSRTGEVSHRSGWAEVKESKRARMEEEEKKSSRNALALGSRSSSFRKKKLSGRFLNDYDELFIELSTLEAILTAALSKTAEDDVSEEGEETLWNENESEDGELTVIGSMIPDQNTEDELLASDGEELNQKNDPEKTDKDVDKDDVNGDEKTETATSGAKLPAKGKFLRLTPSRLSSWRGGSNLGSRGARRSRGSNKRGHQKDKGYMSCEHCSYRTKCSTWFKRHLETHVDKRFVCLEVGCDFAAKYPSRLTQHTKRAHSVKVATLTMSPTPIDELPKETETSPPSIEESPKEAETSPPPVDELPKEVETSPLPVNESPKEVETSPPPVDEFPKEAETSPPPIYESPKEVETSPSPPLSSTMSDSPMTTVMVETQNNSLIYYWCHLCGYLSTTLMLLNNHMEKNHCVNSYVDSRPLPYESSPHICDVCGYKMLTAKGLKVHKMRVHGYSQPCNVYKCDVCSYETMLSINLKRHKIRAHPTLPDDQFSCDLCDFTSPQSSGLKTHWVKMHKSPEKEDKRLQCDVCGFKTPLSIALKRHKCKVHRVEENSGEPLKEANMKKELQEVSPVKSESVVDLSPNLPPLEFMKCSKCFYMATSTKSLMDHETIAHPTYTCSYCGYDTVSAEALRRHKSISRHGDYVCHLCSYRAVKKNLLIKHMRKMHPATLVAATVPPSFSDYRRELKCNECPFITTRKSQLLRHAIVHTGRPYKTCLLCGFIATTPGRLSQHMVRHTRNNLLQCNSCPFKTACSFTLSRHRVEMHDAGILQAALQESVEAMQEEDQPQI